MKKSTRKSVLRLSTVACMAVIALVATLFISSCQKEDSDSCTQWDSYEYLDISDEAVFSNMAKWSASDMEILRQANARTTIQKGEDGLYCIGEKSAEELNISPKLYAISQQLIDDANNFRLRKAAEMRHFPLTKSSTPEEGGGSNSISDCVAQSISDVLKQFGKSVSAENINTNLEATYGAGMGVPVNKFIEELEKYFKGREVSVDRIPSNYQRDGKSTTVYLLGVKYTGGGGHAAPIEKVSNDWIYVKDIQNQYNGKPVLVFKDEIIKVYKATGGL